MPRAILAVGALSSASVSEPSRASLCEPSHERTEAALEAEREVDELDTASCTASDTASLSLADALKVLEHEELDESSAADVAALLQLLSAHVATEPAASPEQLNAQFAAELDERLTTLEATRQQLESGHALQPADTVMLERQCERQRQEHAELKEIQGDAARHDFYTHLRMSLQGGLHACEILARKMGTKLQMARKLGPNQGYLKQEAKAYSAGAAAKSCASALLSSPTGQQAVESAASGVTAAQNHASSGIAASEDRASVVLASSTGQQAVAAAASGATLLIEGAGTALESVPFASLAGKALKEVLRFKNGRDVARGLNPVARLVAQLPPYEGCVERVCSHAARLVTMRLKDDVKALYNRKDGKLANLKAWAKAEEGNTPLRRRAIECAEKMLVAVVKGEVAVHVDLHPEDQPADVAERLAQVAVAPTGDASAVEGAAPMGGSATEARTQQSESVDAARVAMEAERQALADKQAALEAARAATEAERQVLADKLAALEETQRQLRAEREAAAERNATREAEATQLHRQQKEMEAKLRAEREAAAERDAAREAEAAQLRRQQKEIEAKMAKQQKDLEAMKALFGFGHDVGDGSTIMQQRKEALGLFGPKGKAEANASAALVHMQRVDGRTDTLAHSMVMLEERVGRLDGEGGTSGVRSTPTAETIAEQRRARNALLDVGDDGAAATQPPPFPPVAPTLSASPTSPAPEVQDVSAVKSRTSRTSSLRNVIWRSISFGKRGGRDPHPHPNPSPSPSPSPDPNPKQVRRRRRPRPSSSSRRSARRSSRSR